jgi:hypothetical protein
MPLAALFGFPPWARPTLCPTPISHAAIRTTRPVLYGALAFIMLVLLAALYWGTGSSSTNAAFALRPLCVAQGRRWCNHDHPRWGEHTLWHDRITCHVLDTPASLIGSELPRTLAPALCSAPP